MPKSTPDDEFPVIGVDSFYSLRGVDDEPETAVSVESYPVFIPDSPAAKSAPKSHKEG